MCQHQFICIYIHCLKHFRCTMRYLIKGSDTLYLFKSMNTLNQLEWLLGKWQGQHGSGSYHEEWAKVNENKFEGKAYMIINDKTSSPEKLTLEFIGKEIDYIADVNHNPSPVHFRMTSETDNEFVFENPEHDFPQKITYIHPDNDTLIATIEAEKDGKTKKAIFTLKRVSID